MVVLWEFDPSMAAGQVSFVDLLVVGGRRTLPFLVGGTEGVEWMCGGYMLVLLAIYTQAVWRPWGLRLRGSPDMGELQGRW